MKAIASLIYFFSLITIYATYLNNESSELQYILYNDMGQEIIKGLLHLGLM